MKQVLPRRQFLQCAASAAAGVALGTAARGEPPKLAGNEVSSFSFVLLGDLHFDKLEHHDLSWLEQKKKGDLGQIRNYSRITADIMPQLFATVRATVADLNRTPSTRCPSCCKWATWWKASAGAKSARRGRTRRRSISCAVRSWARRLFLRRATTT